MPYITAIAILFVSFFAKVSLASEPLSPVAIRGLPTCLGSPFMPKGEALMFPELRVQSFESDSVPSIAILAMFRSSTFAHPTFNSFGDFSSGRPYKIVMTDEDWNHVSTLVDNSDAYRSIPHPDNWINLPRSSIIGKCYWFNQALEARVRETKDTTPLTLTPEKMYLLHLVVSRRAFTVSPLLGNRFERERRQTEWKDLSLDEFVCRSEPVAIRISESGKCQIVQQDLLPHAFSFLQAECRLDADCLLELRSFAVNDRDRHKRALNPFLRRVNGLDPLSIDIQDSDGAVPDFVTPFASIEPRLLLSYADAIDVPTDGIVGTVRQFYDPCPKGHYSISVTCSGNIWLSDFPVNDPASGQWRATKSPKQSFTAACD